MEKQKSSSQFISSLWWVQFCEWLTHQRGVVWGDIIFAVILNVFAGWLLTPLGSVFSNTPLGALYEHPLIPCLAGMGFILVSLIVALIARYSKRGCRPFGHQQDAYQYLINVINRDGAKEAVLIQYSCKTSINILRVLLRKGARVTVYIQHEDMPAKIGSQFQAKRIIDTTQNLREELGDALLKPDKLKVYKYHTPASMSAIKIDNRILCTGLYTYEQRAHSDHRAYPNDTLALSGHDRAAIVAWKGTNEFSAFDQTFRALEKNYQKYAEVVPL